MIDLKSKSTVALALGLMIVIAMMILPIPSWVLDFGLAISFSLAILVFTIVLFIERPIDFSAFPTILLGTLVLRLSLNISSTKLIIGNGHTGADAAGNVIQGFAMFIMRGNLLLGIVIFCVLLIVNFMVITKGATRMAEVSARFALDAMPGKQLAIDSDLSSGAITHAEAKARRETEQAETTFFGSLDGASKFVKGDAVAGLLITLLNLLVGLSVGVIQHGMSPALAFETYAILTVGDGLVTQIPAVIVSIASALLLARGGSSGATDVALFAQLGRFPEALGTVSALLLLFAVMPGLPFAPFLLGSVALGTIAALGSKKKDVSPTVDIDKEESLSKETIGDILDLDDIHVEFSPNLVSMILDPATGLDIRIENMRRYVAESYGLILPEIRLTDRPSFSPGRYAVKIHGVEKDSAELFPGKRLALIGDTTGELPTGQDVAEPVYGAPARWIEETSGERAALAGATTVAPSEVLATHLLEVIRRNLGLLLTQKGLRRHLDELTSLTNPDRAEANRALIDALIPDKVPVDLLLSVLRLLLEEGVSIRNLPLILEAIAEARPRSSTAEGITEHVRLRLGFQLVAGYQRADGSLPLLQLAPSWEDIFSKYQLDGPNGQGEVALPPKEFNHLAEATSTRLAEAESNGNSPAIVTSSRRRRLLRSILQAKGINAPVLAFEEIGNDARPALLGVISAA